MTQAKQVSGPWKVVPDDDGYRVTYGRAAHIGRIKTIDAAIDFADQLNAQERTREAAYDLLDRCKMAMSWAHSNHLATGPGDGGPWHLIQAAIHKATGESSEESK